MVQSFTQKAEGWSIVDSIYFCIMTLSTVGYGDLHPTTEMSKIFTVVYLFVGAGIFIGFITKVAEQNKNKKKTSDEKHKKFY